MTTDYRRLLAVSVFLLSLNSAILRAEDLNALPTVPDGFQIEFAAKEPLVHNPCAMAFDDRGRLCLGMGPQYRNPTPDTPGDSIYIMVDKDGDGQFDERKQFATGFNCIQSIAWRGAELWVANAPDLTIVRDFDGDDVADEYVRIYTDLGNLEHGLHGLNWAPDGRLYMSKGNSKGLNREERVAPLAFRQLWGVPAPKGAKDFPPIQKFGRNGYRRLFHDPADDWGREGGVLVCDDHGENLEIVARGFRNPWDIAFDHEFNWQGTDNDQDQGDRVFTPWFGSHYGWGHPWSAHWTGADHLPSAPISGPVFHGSGTGIVFCDSNAFPEEFRKVWFFNDWFQRTTYLYRPEWDGALMQPQDGKWIPFVQAGDSLFKPTDIEVGPDGALYILGWGREYGVVWNDKNEQVNEGRIYRVTAENHPDVAKVDRTLAKQSERSVSDLVSDFATPIPAWRTNAQYELIKRGKLVREELERLLKAGNLTTSQETWAMWTFGLLDQHDKSVDSYLSGRSMIGPMNRRIQATRILAHRNRARGAAGDQRVAVYYRQFRDAEPRIRLAGVQGLRRSAVWTSVDFDDRQRAAFTLRRLVESEKDRVVFYAAWQALRVVLTTKERQKLLRYSKDGARLAILLSLAEDRALSDEDAKRLLTDEDERVRHIAALWMAKKNGNSLLTIEPRQSEFRGQVSITARSGMKPADIRFTTDGTTPTSASARLSGNVTLTKTTTLKAAVFVNDLQAGPVVTRQFESISQYEIQSRSGILAATASSGRRYQIIDGGVSEGRLAYTDRHYAFVRVPRELVNAILVQTSNDDSGSKGDQFLNIETVIPVSLSLGYDTRVEQPPKWLAAGGFKRTDETIQTNDATFQIYERRFDAGTIVLGGNTDQGGDGGKSNYIVALRPAGLPQLAQPTMLQPTLAQVEQGDPLRGKALYYATGGAGCSKCHAATKSQVGFGPSLANLVKQGDATHIVKSVLDPNVQIKEGFAMQLVVTDQGQVLRGLIGEETDSTLTLIHADGQTTAVPKDEIELRESQKISAMPAFDRILTATQIADITAWLLANRKPAPTPQTAKAKAHEFRFRESPEEKPGQLELLVGDQSVLTYVYDDRVTKIPRPYFAHVRSLDGIQVTRNHPPKPGDPDDHSGFHPGIFLAFGDISGNDYWRLKAKVAHDGFVDRPVVNQGKATFAVRNRYLSTNGKTTVCTETCRYEFSVGDGDILIDAKSQFESPDNDFYFGDQEEMGLGVRVATAIREKEGNGRITSSRGKSSAANTWGQPAEWCDYAGTIDERHVGVTIMASPANVRTSWWHNRDYGLFVANLFGRQAMRQGEPSKLVVKKGEKFVLRYGILIHSSDERFDPEPAFEAYLGK
jgi:putative membrane-bound dehydrogenase-like protein